jgi:hypothetical protein
MPDEVHPTRISAEGDRIKTMLLRIGGWKSGSKLEKVPGYGPQRCYHRSTGNN